jgi:murein DD-endopeptidase MepM/ murein hydrolase activator NlpD
MVDAAVGGGLALALITAANAALPRIERLAGAPASGAGRAAKLRQSPPAASPAPAVLIAFQDPLPGYPVVSHFGLRQLPWEDGGRLHAGVDIAAPAGLPVLASADGVVTRVESDPGYGRFVELKHAAGLSTRYAHLSKFLPQVVPGVALKAGQPVGAIGSTGSSTGAHLHFEVRDDAERPLNPELFLGRSFATTADLPLKAAQRIPRGLHVAFVSNIPKAKQEEMEAKLEAKMELAAADAMNAGAADASASGTNASARVTDRRRRAGRPHARLVAHR